MVGVESIAWHGQRAVLELACIPCAWGRKQVLSSKWAGNLWSQRIQHLEVGS
jgi:hypothetical protein